MKKTNKHLRVNRTYKRAYQQIKGYIRQKVQRSQAADDAMEEIRRLLEDGCAEGRTLEELFPQGLEDFCVSIVETLPRYTVEEEWHIRRTKRLRRIIGCAGTVLAAACLLLWYFGIFAYWNEGMWALTGDERNHEYHEIGTALGTAQPMTLELDLSDLDSNIGTMLLEPGELGECSIVVKKVWYSEERNGRRVYQVVLDCKGDYSLDHTTYYYPIVHPTTDIGNGSGINSSVLFHGEEVPNAMLFTGKGPADRDGIPYSFVFLTTDEQALREDPTVTLNFWMLGGHSYWRTGWGR